MNEAETRAELIDKQLQASGWEKTEGARIRREYYITEGRIQTGGRRGQRLWADYILMYKNRQLAVVEAKSAEKSVGEGVGQAKDYAQKLNLKYAYSTNGKEIYEINMQGGEGLVAQFPTPDELWDKALADTPRNNWNNSFDEVPYEDVGGSKTARYYQELAVDNVMSAIAENKDRILLTLATGTGKTFIAFQIVWKLFHSRWNLKRDASRRPRVLFLADRNILADQAFNAFSAFPEDALVRIKPNEIRKQGKVPTNGNIFFTIFQTFMSGSSTSSPTALEEIDIDSVKKAKGYMYILECADGSFYTGSTKDISLRMEQHKNGEGAEYTKNNLPVKLVYYEIFDRIDSAFNREKQIQKWSRAKKLALIQGDTDLLKRLSKNKQAIDESPKVPEPAEGYFGEYPKDYFDFIIIDECHRGGANDESNWRAIMEYFSPAVQLGLTATPKRKDNVDTYKYFGEPVYVYSLKEGIDDGFLTPFKVRRLQSTLDEYTYTSDDTVIEGEVEVGKRYTESDFNRIIEIKAREADRVKRFMDEINQNEKALVFCATQDHAAAVRDLINQYKTSTEPMYCVRVTANDGDLGEEYLRQFQDNELTIPTILTTSQKLSTGVDARNIRAIVLMRPIKQMIEFKQIVGRGTRLFDGKDFFTLYDFVDAHNHFADPEWDGEPEEPVEKPPISHPPRPPYGGSDEPPEPKVKLKIKLRDGKERQIEHMASTLYYGPDGRPISAEQFVENLFGVLPAFFKNEEELRTIWSNPATRKSLLEELEKVGFGREELTIAQSLVNAQNSDLLDVLEYISFLQPPITREVRVAKAQSSIFASINNDQKQFIEFVLSKYIETGVEELDQEKLPQLLTLKYKALDDAKELLGTVETIRNLFVGFQKHLYQQSTLGS